MALNLPVMDKMPEGFVRVATSHGSYGQSVVASGHRLVVDEPLEVGGDGRGPTPYDLLLAALGACTSMTCRLVARREGIPLESVTILLRHTRCHAEDCGAGDEGHPYLEEVERILELHGPLTESERERMLGVADRCAVHRTLTHPLKISTRLA